MDKDFNLGQEIMIFVALFLFFIAFTGMYRCFVNLFYLEHIWD